MSRCATPNYASLPRTHAVYLGISFKTQALYVAVFITRYIEMFTTWISLYNFVMKVFFIGSSCYILYLMHYRFR